MVDHRITIKPRKACTDEDDKRRTERARRLAHALVDFHFEYILGNPDDDSKDDPWSTSS